MMKAIFKGRIFEFDEQNKEAIEKLSVATGYPLEELLDLNLICRVILSIQSFSCSFEMVLESFNELADALDDMIDKALYEHVRIEEKPDYCTFKSRLKPYKKGSGFRRPIFWKRIRSSLLRRPPPVLLLG